MAKYVEGAKPGMIYNTVTSECFDGKKGIKVIPCYYKKDFPEWSDRGDGPRCSGGKFIYQTVR